MGSEQALRLSLARLVRRCDRLTKGLDRAALDKEAKTHRGSGLLRFVSHALMRDIMDAANAGREALARHDAQADKGSGG